MQGRRQRDCVSCLNISAALSCDVSVPLRLLEVKVDSEVSTLPRWLGLPSASPPTPPQEKAKGPGS